MKPASHVAVLTCLTALMGCATLRAAGRPNCDAMTLKLTRGMPQKRVETELGPPTTISKSICGGLGGSKKWECLNADYKCASGSYPHTLIVTYQPEDPDSPSDRWYVNRWEVEVD